MGFWGFGVLGYITEEANDLKALLGMPGAEKHA